MNRREILKSFLVAPAAVALTPEEAKKVEVTGIDQMGRKVTEVYEPSGFASAAALAFTGISVSHRK